MLTQILEGLISKWDKDELSTIQEIIDIIESEKLFNYPVLYRGFGGTKQAFTEVTNDRNSFYGSLNRNASRFVKDILKVKNPTFATADYTQASMFGVVHIFLPNPKDKMYYSSFYRDIMADLGFDEKTDEDLEGLEGMYNVDVIKDLKRKVKSEVIVDSKKYYLINWGSLLYTFKSKFYTPKKDDSKLTWKDVHETLKAHLARINWEIKNDKRRSFDDDKVFQQEQNRKSEESKLQRLYVKNTIKRLEKIKNDAKLNLLPSFEVEPITDKKLVSKYNRKGQGFEFKFRSKSATKQFRKYYNKQAPSRPIEADAMDIRLFLSLDTGSKSIILR